MAHEAITSYSSTADQFYNKQINDPTTKDVHDHQFDIDEDEYFDLQPNEKKLCAYSLGLGLVLMAVFIVAFEAF